MEKYGKAFRHFRLQNGFSLEIAAGEVISKSQLSRFERGETEISVIKFFKLLSNIDVSIESFCNYLNNYRRQEIDDFLVSLSSNFYSFDKKRLEKLKFEQQQLFEKNGKIINQLNSIMIQGLLNQMDQSYEVTSDSLSVIYEYLFSKQPWEYYEIILIGNLYHLFEMEYIFMVGQEIIENILYYENIGKIRNLVISACLNFWFHCLEKSCLEYANYFEKKLKKIINDETKIFEKSIYKYVEGYKIYLTDSKEAGIKQMQDVIRYFEFIESEKIALYFQERMNNVIN